MWSDGSHAHALPVSSRPRRRRHRGSNWSSCTPLISSCCSAAHQPRRPASALPRSSTAAPLPFSESLSFSLSVPLRSCHWYCHHTCTCFYPTSLNVFIGRRIRIHQINIALLGHSKMLKKKAFQYSKKKHQPGVAPLISLTSSYDSDIQ